MLQKLPPELLSEVLEDVRLVCHAAPWIFTDRLRQLSKNDLRNFCQVSKPLYSATIPYLYRSINFVPDNENDVSVFSLEGYTEARDKGYFRHARRIEVTAPFHCNIEPYMRCVHHFTRPGYEVKFATDFMPFLSACTAGRLREFNWTLGTCIPPTILGPNGYLNIHQQDIDTLRLITDGSCRSEDAPDGLDLNGFPNLKRLAYSGLAQNKDVKALANLLQKCSHQLLELDLDLENYLALTLPGEDPCIFPVQLLRLQRPVQVTFPVLQNLSLCQVSFTTNMDLPTEMRGYEMSDATKMMFEAFDFASLTSLRLRHCPGWELLIAHLTNSVTPLTLESFEVQYIPTSITADSASIIAPFLKSFKGLVNLFLFTSSPAPNWDIWVALRGHKATLRRFVHHQRTLEESEFPLELDALKMGFNNDKDFEGEDGSNPLSTLDLTSAGLCVGFQYMPSMVKPFTENSTLRFLHVRRSAGDIRPTFDAATARPLSRSVSFDSASSDGLGWGRSPSYKDSDQESTDQTDQERPTDSSPVAAAWTQLPESREELESFLQWVFGPRGVVSLRLVAYGDFSRNGRHVECQWVYCRNEEAFDPQGHHLGDDTIPNFRKVNETDGGLLALFDENEDVVGALPLEPLFNYPTRDWDDLYGHGFIG